MGLQYVREPDDGDYVIATARLCKTEDGARLVPDTDPDARWLFCVPGARIPRADAERYGLLSGGQAEERQEPAKSRPAPVNKARNRSADK